MDVEALLLTARLAGATTALLMLLGLPLAWWIAREDGWGRAVVQALVGLPLLLPPTVLGFYLLVLLGPLTAPGRAVTALFGHPLAFSFGGLLVGSVVYSLPFAVQPLVAGFRGVDEGYLEAAAGIGMGPWGRLVSVVLPAVRSSIGVAAVLAFSHTVGEFGVVLMIGGNLAGVTRTLSIVLFDQVQDFNYAAANRTAGLLVAFAVVTLALVYGLRGRRADVL